MPHDKKDYLLKLIQAWMNLKVRIASFVLIGNGAVLGTAVAVIKDKGVQSEGVFPLRLSALGIMLGSVALWIAYSYSSNYLTIQFEGKPKAPKPKRPLTKWQLELVAKSETLAFTNKWFNFFIFCSAGCLIATIGYLSGIIDGRLLCIATQPGCD